MEALLPWKQLRKQKEFVSLIDNATALNLFHFFPLRCHAYRSAG